MPLTNEDWIAEREYKKFSEGPGGIVQVNVKLTEVGASSDVATETTLAAFKTAFDDAVANYISHIDDISVYSAQISSNTASMDSTLTNYLVPMQASLDILDDWDESDRCKVNLIAGQVGVQGGSGTISALTQRVVLATNQPAIPTVSTVTTVGTLSAMSKKVTGWGAKSGIGTTAVQIASDKPSYGVWIKADNDNTATIAIGGTGVTYRAADATDGYELRPSEEVYVHESDMANLYAIAASGTQR